jgi:hypothetical protein
MSLQQAVARLYSKKRIAAQLPIKYKKIEIKEYGNKCTFNKGDEISGPHSPSRLAIFLVSALRFALCNYLRKSYFIYMYLSVSTFKLSIKSVIPSTFSFLPLRKRSYTLRRFLLTPPEKKWIA